MANEVRLIDANALIAEYDRVHTGSPGRARTLMEDAHTVDAVPVVHGRWEPWAIQPNGFIGSYCCTACKMVSMNDSDYCPNCGAKMDGDGDG